MLIRADCSALLAKRRDLPWIAFLVTCSAALGPLTEASDAATASATSAPVADAYVSSAAPTRNYGASTKLRLDGSPTVRSYLRFDVTGVEAPVTRATLSLWANSSSSRGFDIRPVENDSWGELSLTYLNRPSFGAVAAGTGPFGSGRRVSIDVTPLVTGNGPVSIALTARSSTAIALASREAGANGPRLTVEGAATTAPPPPSEDSPPSPDPTQPPPGDAQPSFPIRAAFYYPWFPEAWNQAGIYPFTKYTPSLGFYSSAGDSVRDAHVRSLEHAKVEAGIYSWWGQGSKEDVRFPGMLTRTNALASAVKWAPYHEREGNGPDPTVAAIGSDLDYIKARYSSDPAYLRVGNKPVIFVYGDAADGCGMVDRWHQANTAARDFYVVLKVFPGYSACAGAPESWHQYSPAVRTDRQVGYSFAISPEFDLTGSEPQRLARDLPAFKQAIREMVASNEPWQLITTFNEWGENSATESATEWSSGSGHGAYLDALRADGADSAPPPSAAPLVAAGGDISCAIGTTRSSGSCHQMDTSDLLVAKPFAAMLPLGDLQYEEGTLAAFDQMYDPSWGRVKAATRPAVGNHEYLTPGAAGYFDYFGAQAGERTKGYYAFDVGKWRLYAINSNCSQVGGCGAGSPQVEWLKADLAANPRSCVLAYSHHPRFSSGQHGSFRSMAVIWRTLHAAGAELFLSGHDHNYERFAPQSPAGRSDLAKGMRQFVVGTGGKNLRPLRSALPNSEVRNDDAFGVLELKLHPRGYEWRFVPEQDATFTDSGSGACH